jgi:hypothetical protein
LRRAVAIVYVTLALAVLFGFISLAVDLGRAQLVKTELQRAADAAARHAMNGYSQGVTVAVRNAQDAADDNLADGTPVLLDANQDVEFGNWDGVRRTFAPLSGAARGNGNAIRVTARRVASRGNAVPLLFGKVVGVSQCDVAATAIIAVRRGYTLVGIDSVLLSGVALIDSFDSTNGAYSAAAARDRAIVASNGDIQLIGSPLIRGEAHAGTGQRIIGSATITGSSAPLAEPLVFPMPTVDPAYNNAAIHSILSSARDLNMSGNRTYNIPAGTYYVRNMSLGGNATMRLSGEVTFYVSGNVSLSGSIDVTGDRAADFKLRAVTAGTDVRISSATELYADIYAPGSDVVVGGSGDLYGTVVGKTLELSGRGGVHWDESVYPYGGRAGGIMLVR